MTKKIKLNGNGPATQKDLALWGGPLQEQINDLKKGQTRLESRMTGLDQGRMESLEVRMTSLESGQASILDLISS